MLCIAWVLMTPSDYLWLPIAVLHMPIAVLTLPTSSSNSTSYTASFLCKYSHRFSHSLTHPESLWLSSGHYVSPDLILKLVFSTLLFLPNPQPCLAMRDSVIISCSIYAGSWLRATISDVLVLRRIFPLFFSIISSFCTQLSWRPPAN